MPLNFFIFLFERHEKYVIREPEKKIELRITGDKILQTYLSDVYHPDVSVLNAWQSQTRPCLDKAYRKHTPKRHCGKKFHVRLVKLSTKDNLYLPECPLRRENISNRLPQVFLPPQKKEYIPSFHFFGGNVRR